MTSIRVPDWGPGDLPDGDDVDRIGTTSTEFRDADGHREPVMTSYHKWAMIRDLYAAGWSYRLIAQFCGMPSEMVREALASNGRSITGSTP